MGTGISGDFLSCIKGVKYTFKREPGIPLQTLLWKRASSCGEGKISCFFSSCGGKLGVPVNLRWRPHGPDCVSSEKSGLFPCCEGHVGIPLQSPPGNRAMSRVLLVNSVFCPRRQGSRASSQGSTRESGLVWCQGMELLSVRVVKVVSGLLLSSGRGIGDFSRGSARESGLPSCCEGILGVQLEPLQGNQDLSRVEWELGVLFPCSRICGVPPKIQ